MRPVTRLWVAALVVGACLAAAAVAWAGEALTVNAGFTPDTPGAPTNLSLTASFVAGAEQPPSPVTKFELYAPAGMGVDLRGAGTCAALTLETRGPGGCPEDSRAGFGGGVGVLDFPGETVHESYTLDFFFASKQSGHLKLLVYARAVAPVEVELVLVARQIPVPKPYGLGFSVEVPPISTVPGAANASIESAFITVGGANVAYYESVNGKRRLVHLEGVTVPKRCPAAGFPIEGSVSFADGSTLKVNSDIACPHG